LVVIETHPIQYHVPVYRTLQQDFGIPVTVIYGSDFSIAGYHDREFGAAFAWDTDLLSGYTSVFLSRSERGGAQSDREVNIRGLEAALAAAQPQALLCVGYSPQFHIQAFRCAYRTRKPILFRGETSDHAVRRSAIKKAFRDVVLRRLYRKCSALLYVGSRSRQHYERLGVADESLFFSPYCVDTTPFKLDESSRSELRGAVRRELGIPEDRLVIAFSGKLSRRKAPDQIIEAVKRFPAEIRERSVVLTIGDGELRDSLQAAANEAPTVAIRQVGFQHQMNLSRYYHSADVLVLPSVHGETWGLVVNEALHHGLPAVVSDSVGCAPDLIEPGKTGQVYRGGSVEGLSAALIDCLPLVGVAAARSNCRARVARYTTVRAAEGIATAWQASCRSVYQRKLAWMRD
jgi:glycosyltransferase involved in cell wall biosynthesis